jgi:putative spermidine/putrescine transport system permease protein
MSRVRPGLARLRSDWPILAALAPFIVFFLMFEAVPVAVLLQGSIGGLKNPTSLYLTTVFTHPVYRQSVINSFMIAGISALIGAVAGTAIGYALTVTRHTRIRGALIALANVTSNAGGIGLAFAFITVIGVSGGITAALRLVGIDLYSFFTLYSVPGLIVLYVYFQTPLMIILMLPSFAAIRNEWREASASLGGTTFEFWRSIGIPVLFPAIAAGTILMLASGLGALATAVAQMGGQANLMTVQVSVLRQGEVIFKPAQADALATVLLVFVAASVVLYNLVNRRAQRWTN